MKTFPKPLSADEEQRYLLRFQRGDPKAKNILIEHNLRLVAHVAKKYQGCDEDQDDLICGWVKEPVVLARKEKVVKELR